MKRILLYIFLLCGSVSALSAQNLSGNVLGLTPKAEHEKLSGATLFWLGTDIGTVTDSVGKFTIPFTTQSDKLVVSYIGYEDDTLRVKSSLSFMNIVKQKSLRGEEVLIQTQTTGTTISTLNPQLSQSITTKELYKAACCNLGESFQTNAAIDVSYQDALTGAKQIRLLGLSGIYSQIITENSPTLRGLATGYGLGYIPGPWMERIDIAKGAASVLNGYEGLTGQINIEYKKPENSPRIFLNLYANQMARLESSIHYATPLDKKKRFHTMLMLHGNIIPMAMDRNKDGFADEHLQKQWAAHNRWTYFGPKGLELQLSVKELRENRQAGQVLRHDHSSSTHPYTIEMDTRRTEIMYKTGWASPKKPTQSVGFVLTGIYHRQQGFFGHNTYRGNETNFNAKIVYQTILGNTNHTLRTGLSYTFDKFDERYRSFSAPLLEKIPGVFGEYTYNYLERFSLVAGIRADKHNLYGTILTPRVHLRYLPTEKTILRLSAGSGTRVPHIFTDNAGLWASGREISIPKPLNPERGWNYGASIQQYFPLFHENARLIVDFFRTDFQNQVVVDRESAHMLSFYNLEGRSYAHAFQIEQMAEVVHGLEITAAYKWNDVRMTYQSGTKRMPFVPRHRGLITATYNTPNKLWSFDITAQFIGQSRIPDVSENSSATNWTNTSKPYTQLFAQVTRNHRDWAFYIGGENLGNFTQKNPIISVNDPYHPNFDATMVWGPIYGAMGYVGLRWSWNPKTKIQ